MLQTELATIRPATLNDAPAIARVHVDTWRTNYTGIIPEEHLANLSYERCQAGWVEHLPDQRGGESTYVVEIRSGEIVAFASGGPAREATVGFDGELYVLYVLKSFQGKGFGRSLVIKIAQKLDGQRYRSMIVWVLKDNPACRFYEKLGGRLIGEKTVTIGGKSLVDVSYGWSDLAAFR